MKHLFSLFLSFHLTVSFISAQKSGSIVYRETIKIDVPANVPPQFRDQIPPEIKANKILVFSGSESIYKLGEQDASDEDVNMDGPGGAMRMRFRNRAMSADDQTYKNLDEGFFADSKDFMGKQFLIEDQLMKYNWKVTGDKKQILSYMVMEATTMINDTTLVSAWFSPQIPVSNGPDVFGGLPGIILEVAYADGKRIMTASEVKLNDDMNDQISRPKKGKKVSREDFDKIRREKMKEMREQGGGGFRFIQSN